ncbi:hypothetical protein PHO31112_01236 [Pandoraea horticolens]|uniref:DUF4148 domain-containing protein n=1 Tax=Pandoraea horticolens TaxID=2508298 RepID=A0A5E4T6K6_9BURK|nr:DUF4148 domain-containing protein [Pandoraea horticolens]VVD83465.1 hypothetical protein PHO31112_01236 [Pandoraea horticolens]
MNRKLVASALVSTVMVTAAGAAFAQSARTSDAYPEGTQFAWVAQTSQVTREQVRQELADARAQGLIPQNDYEYPALHSIKPGKTRAQVYEELVRARQNGEMKCANP